MKRDGRTLDHKTLEEFRLLAVRRVREGEKPSAVVRSLGLNRTSIYRWLKAKAQSGEGVHVLSREFGALCSKKSLHDNGLENSELR